MRVMDDAEELDEILSGLHTGVRAALGANAVGLYLRGSLALGDFDPETSDVDFLAVVERPVSEAELAALSRLHAELARLPNRYADRLEGSYIHRAALKRFPPGERLHPTIGTDWEFGWGEHRDNWLIELATVRERGRVLFGPDPKTLIDPISAEQVREAVRGELAARLSDWAAVPGVPEWLLPRYYQAFEVETMCRALYTLAHGGLPTKPQAVTWALEALPEPWRTLVRRSQELRSDRTPDPAGVEEIKSFVRWAAASSSGSSGW
jgi:hypothetical protein